MDITKYSLWHCCDSVPFATPYLSSDSETNWVVTQYGTSGY